jgi:hypothetical protein
MRCWPDWDITTPELKAAWAEGRKELSSIPTASHMSRRCEHKINLKSKTPDIE